MNSTVKKEVTEKMVTVQSNQLLPSGSTINISIEIKDADKAVGKDTSYDINKAVDSCLKNIQLSTNNWGTI